MNKEYLSHQTEKYELWLRENEKSPSTISQYKRDIIRFISQLPDMLTKEAVIAWKEGLRERYKPASVNVKIAAVNGFFDFIGRADLKVKQLKIQKSPFCPAEKELSREEYIRLVNAAQKDKTHGCQYSLILQTICSTGIRVSELCYITAEAVKKGEAMISLKGKTRTILLPDQLCGRLSAYIIKEKIRSGPVFIGRHGRPLNRTVIWRMMKNLCSAAGVKPEKVFPHNLRHLFARCFYEVNRDMAKLADVLGHSSINTTRLYIISSSKEHRRVLEKMKLVI